MDIYSLPSTLLQQIPAIEHWQEIHTLVKRAASKKPHDWQLPLIGCAAVGGDTRLAFPAVAAMAYAQISIILIDDMLDEDPRGEYNHIGMPAAANLAATFQSLAVDALLRPEPLQNCEAQRHAAYSINEMLHTTAYGQFLDTRNPATETDYWRMVETKSAPFFGIGLHTGALLGGASVEIANQLRRFGHLYGEIIQIHDDLNDSMDQPANPDWVQGRLPLPILYAQTVDHADRARFLQLREHISNAGALGEAQEILVRCGAVSYGIHQLLERCQQAQSILRSIPLHDTQGLEQLLGNLMTPVWGLFEEAGANTDDIRARLAALPILT